MTKKLTEEEKIERKKGRGLGKNIPYQTYSFINNSFKDTLLFGWEFSRGKRIIHGECKNLELTSELIEKYKNY